MRRHDSHALQPGGSVATESPRPPSSLALRLRVAHRARRARVRSLDGCRTGGIRAGGDPAARVQPAGNADHHPGGDCRLPYEALSSLASFVFGTPIGPRARTTRSDCRRDPPISISFRKCNPPNLSSAVRAGRSRTCRTIRFHPPGSCRRPSGITRDPDAPGPLRMSLRWPIETWAKAGNILDLIANTPKPHNEVGRTHIHPVNALTRSVQTGACISRSASAPEADSIGRSRRPRAPH